MIKMIKMYEIVFFALHYRIIPVVNFETNINNFVLHKIVSPFWYQFSNVMFRDVE